MNFKFAARVLTVSAALAVATGTGRAEDVKPIEIPGAAAYPESITVGPDGTLFLSSLASGGVKRVKPALAKAEEWIAPGAAGSRSTFGVYADAKANTLWVCSNDVKAFGVAGPGNAQGSHLLAFDLGAGNKKADYPFPSGPALCNDVAVAKDGTVYVTNSLAPQILRLAPGAKQLDVFAEDEAFQPAQGIGLDGIALGDDGNIYVNTFNGNGLFRVAVKNGQAGLVTKLSTSRPISLPDGLRNVQGQEFLMIEGVGFLDRVSIVGDQASIESLTSALHQPTGVAKVGDTAYVTEGQLPHLFGAKENGPPSLPFKIVAVRVGH